MTEQTEVSCARCHVAMSYKGTKEFFEGKNWGMFGEIGELFVKHERFDVYFCPRCGVVELFLDGVGDELRKEQPGSA